MDIKIAKKLINAHQCFFCYEHATRIGYYQKDYSSGKPTIENPTFFCDRCWNDLKIRSKIFCGRGGIEGVFCILFTSLAKMSKKQIGILTGRKNYEINQLSNPVWKKMIFSLHFLNLPPKRNLNGEGIDKGCYRI